jgi:hypothetical protein
MRMTKKASGPIDMKEALLDPAAVFGTPEELERHPALTKEQKIELLRRWEYDESEEEVAADEGMPGGDSKLLRRVMLALDRLTGGVDVERTGASKQAGLPRQSKKSE